MNKNRKIKTMLVLALAGSITASIPVFAREPRFARSDEEWATLEDNNLEYGEIEDLIAEYNATVRSNEVALAKFKRDYGRTNTEVSDKYRENAQEILDNLDDPDPSDPTYVAMLSSVATARATAQNLLSSADSTLEDADIIRLGYEQAEKTLAQTATTNMISYKSGQIAIEVAKGNLELANIALNTANAKLNAGTGTNIDVLNAKEKVLNAQNAVNKAISDNNTVLRRLQVMTGWSYNASPNVGDIPAPDMNRVFDPSADLSKALENNYTLKINEKKLANASSDSDKQSLKLTVEDNKKNIATALVVAAQNIASAKESYNYANSFASLQETNLVTANQRFSLGMISKLELDTQRITTDNAKRALEQSRYAINQAIANYDWAIKGLAPTS
ncbi:MAG: TolC family protein [Lachnoanaerobaculum saburreum]